MILPFWLDKKAIEHIRERTANLFLVNDIRFLELLENIQFGFAYAVIGFIAGIILDYIFPIIDEEKHTFILVLEIILQCLLLIVFVFYVRKIVKIMPDGATNINYKPYGSNEFEGEIMIPIVMFGTQVNLIKKIDLLSRRFYMLLYNEEKLTGF